MNTVSLPAAARATARAAVLAIAIASIGLAGAAHAQGHHSRGGGGGGGGVYVHGGHGHGHGDYGRGGYYRGGHGRGGWPAWGAVGLGLGLGFGLGLGLGSYPVYDAAPTYTLVEPPPVVVYQALRPVPRYSQSPAAAGQPVIYPRSGQSAAQIDADSNACSEWAGGQPNARTDFDLFRRGIAACMDARGYTLR